MYNRQEIIGNLGNDATIRDVGENRKAISLRVGSTKRFLSHGEEVSHTEWFNVEFFASERQADYYARNALKGAMIHAAGETETELYTVQNEQRTKTVVKCHVNDVQVLKAPAQRTQQQSTPDRQQQQQPQRQNHQQGQNEAPAATKRADLMDFNA